MAEPFVFYFSPDASGRPELMTIVDLRLACSLCGHPQLQRFYHSVAFHPMTLASVARSLESAHELGGYVCENCGEPVGSDAVTHAAVTVGMPDESAEVVGVRTGEQTFWRVRGNRRLDPQQLPSFEETGAAELTEELFEDGAGRVFSAKQALLELLEDDSTGWVRVSSDMGWLVASDEELDDLVEEVVDALGLEDAMFLPVDECELDQIGTHQDISKLSGRFERWAGELPEKVVGAVVGIDRAREIFDRVLEVGRLQSHRLDDDGMIVWSEVTTPGGIVFPHEISLESILQRAVLTGMTPGEAARLTGEELVGMLLRVWKPEAR